MTNTVEPKPDPEAINTLSGCLVRVLWLLLGPALLLVALVATLADGRPTAGPADAAFLALLGFVVAARLLDRAAARPSRGRFTAWVVALGGGFWLLGRGLVWLSP